MTPTVTDTKAYHLTEDSFSFPLTSFQFRTEQLLTCFPTWVELHGFPLLLLLTHLLQLCQNQPAESVSTSLSQRAVLSSAAAQQVYNTEGRCQMPHHGHFLAQEWWEYLAELNSFVNNIKLNCKLNVLQSKYKSHYHLCFWNITLCYTDHQDELSNPTIIIHLSHKSIWEKWQNDSLETTWASCTTEKLQFHFKWPGLQLMFNRPSQNFLSS